MRDWSDYVRGRLGSCRGGRTVDEGIVCELAGHLEELHAALRGRGLSEDEAFAQACEQAGNWEELQRGIISAKEEGAMRERVRQIWIPALMTALISYAALAVFRWVGVRPSVVHAGEARALVVYLPWLGVLPFIGAIGGFLSRRAEGDRRRAYFAAGLPSGALAGILVLIFALALVIDRGVAWEIKGTAFAATVASWVVLPGIALWFGAFVEGFRKGDRAG